jgi:hypothetical protein
MQNPCPRPPGRGEGRPPRANPTHAKGSPRRMAVQSNLTKTTTSAHIIARAQHVVDRAALLALDVASIAAESGRGDHAKAALHLLDTAHYAWLAAEVLAEAVCQ